MSNSKNKAQTQKTQEKPKSNPTPPKPMRKSSAIWQTIEKSETVTTMILQVPNGTLIRTSSDQGVAQSFLPFKVTAEKILDQKG